MEERKPCCELNKTLQGIYYEQINGKKGYSLGYYTIYYYLLKDYKQKEKLCANCADFVGKLWEIYLKNKQK